MSEISARKTVMPTDVPGLMVPLQGRPLLVPNLAVAEIVPFDAPVPVAGKPAWFLGQMLWRGVRIPVISLALLRGDDEELPPEVRIAVFNGLDGKLPFYGIISHGIPRLVRVRAQDLEPTEGMYTPFDDAFVAVGGELAIIPNLVQIENTIAAA